MCVFGGTVPLTSSQSVTVWLSLTEPLCFLLMNSLISVLKRTAWVLSCLRAAIRTLMVLLTSIWAGVTLAHFIFLRLLWFFYVFTQDCAHLKFPLEFWGHCHASFCVCYEQLKGGAVLRLAEVLVLFWPFYIQSLLVLPKSLSVSCRSSKFLQHIKNMQIRVTGHTKLPSTGWIGKLSIVQPVTAGIGSSSPMILIRQG